LKYNAVDDLGTAAGGPVAAQKIIGDSSVMAVVGPAFSGATQASESFFTQANLASITASATKPSLTDAKNGFKTFFRAVANDNAQGNGAAAYIAAKLKAKKVYSIDDAEAYGQGLSKVFEAALQSKNIPFVHDSVPQGTKQYEPAAGKVVQSGADVVYYSGYYADAGPLLKALKAGGFKGTFMSDDGAKDPNLIKLAGTANAEGTFLTCPCVDAAQNPSSASFVSAYKAAFNADPGTYSAEAYDAANAVISAMKGIGASVDRAKVVDAVRNLDYTGITKTIKFQSSGELASTAVYLYEVKNGAITYLGPVDKLATS
jgi:branched-chain amino acid transport system substrate-binding protein